MSTRAAELWEQAAADCAQQRRTLRQQNALNITIITELAARLTHLEQLIIRFADTDRAFLNPNALLEASKALAKAEEDLRVEADHIRAVRARVRIYPRHPEGNGE